MSSGIKTVGLPEVESDLFETTFKILEHVNAIHDAKTRKLEIKIEKLSADIKKQKRFLRTLRHEAKQVYKKHEAELKEFSKRNRYLEDTNRRLIDENKRLRLNQSALSASDNSSSEMSGPSPFHILLSDSDES